ncbi:hypothetical protein HanIR_Chr09g0396131 [Helianthus annuus]|nr:hypothetical protein HanIR_Chr09g0396131 [Helianthus annuus]
MHLNRYHTQNLEKKTKKKKNEENKQLFCIPHSRLFIHTHKQYMHYGFLKISSRSFLRR